MVPEAIDAKARLLDAAVRCFAEKGLDGVGIREIAQRAGVNSAAVSYHFGGKEALYLAAVQEVAQCGVERVASLAPIPGLYEEGARAAAVRGLKDHVRAFMEELLECDDTPYGEAGQILMAREMQQPHPDVVPYLREQMRPYVEHMAACVRTLRPDLDEAGVMRAGISIHGQCLIYVTHRGIVRMLLGSDPTQLEFDGLVQHIAAFSLRGLGLSEAEIQGA